LQDSGVIAMAQIFDGNDDYVDMGNVLNPGTSNFTVSAWVKRESLDAWNTVIAKTNGGNPSLTYGWEMTIDNTNALHCYIATGGLLWGNIGTFDMASTVSITDLTGWHYVTAVINRSSNNNCRLYIDGQQVTTTSRGSISTVGNISNIVPLRIGIQADNNFGFTGSMDEAVMSFTARSADWVRLCYMNQKPQDALIQFR
ncbi:MAG: LamG domain-containing protein, partial [Chitinispirillaceae bacterium]|nr:LamG domain-containing protein [Chitinispirillaceae bacterium]